MYLFFASQREFLLDADNMVKVDDYGNEECKESAKYINASYINVMKGFIVSLMFFCLERAPWISEIDLRSSMISFSFLVDFIGPKPKFHI